MKSDKNDETENPSSAEQGSRPYEPPAIVDSAQFETLALTCTTTAGTPTCEPPFGTPVGS